METKKQILGNGWSQSVKVVKQPNFYKKVADTELLESSEYDKFNFDKKNRPVYEEKIKFYMGQFGAGKFFLKEFPVIIDADRVVLDGQHRFEAAKRLGLPIYFRFASTLTLSNVIDIQINAGWTQSDYLHAYIQQGNMNYVILSRFVLRYKFSMSIAASLLVGRQQVGLKAVGFYEGNFQVKDETKAHEQAKVICELGELALGLHKDRAFCAAVITMMAHPEFEKKRMIDQLNKYASLIRRQMTNDAYLRNLEEVYNYKLYQKNKVRFI